MTREVCEGRPNERVNLMRPQAGVHLRRGAHRLRAMRWADSMEGDEGGDS